MKSDASGDWLGKADQTSVCIGYYDPERDELRVYKHEPEQFLGYEDSDCLRQGFLSSVVHEDDLPLFSAVWQRWLDTDIFQEMSLRLKCHSGDYMLVGFRVAGDLPAKKALFPLRLTASLKPYNGKTCLQKNALLAMQQAGFQVLCLSANGDILEANQATSDFLGYSLEELLRLKIFDIDAQCSKERFTLLLDELRSNKGQIRFETRYICNDGDSHPVEVFQLSLAQPEGDDLFIAIVQDISRRYEDQQAIALEHQRANYYLDIAGVIMVTLDLEGRVTLLNRFACQLLGVDQSEAIGLDWFDNFLPEVGRIPARRAYNRLMSLGTAPNQEVEKHVLTRSGEERLILWYNRVLEDEHGNRVGILSSGTDITDKTEMSGQLSLVNAMVDHSFDPLICASPDEQFRIIYANDAAIQHFGVSAELLYKTHIFDWDPDHSLSILKNNWRSIQTQPRKVETRHRLTSGEEIPIEASSRAFVYHDTDYMITVFKDLRDRISFQTAVKTAQERSKLLLEHSNEGIFGLDCDGVTTFINPAAAMMLGYDPDELIGKRNHDLIHHSDVNGVHMPESECRMILAIRNEKSYRVETDVLWRKDGTCFPVEYWSSPILDNDHVVGAVVTFHDITHRKQAEEQIRYLAFHDSLTGLPNRRLFMDRFEHEISQEKRSGLKSALHMLDLDHFKEINDTLGHPAGDQLLIAAAQRIEGLLREGDTFARLGGDEFAILQSNIKDLSDVASLASKVIQSFNNSFLVSGSRLRTNTSIGIVICDTETSVNELISRADVALYRAKEQGRGCFVFYQEEMTERVQRDAELAHMLSSARFLQQLYLVYQPQFDCISGRLVGMEALLRWDHPQRGLIPPLTFIPIAEKRGMIDDIGLWVAQHVCMDAVKWISEGLRFGTVSFNLSPVQLRSEQGIKQLLSVLNESGVPLETFEVEVTESACMDASDETLGILEQYVAQGLRIAIDDFGTGYSSMVALKKLSACRLKIDKSFVRDMLHDENDGMIVNATIALAHSLGLSVVAEGVESEEQLSMLTAQGCDAVQGYFLGYPMSQSDTEKFLGILAERTG